MACRDVLQWQRGKRDLCPRLMRDVGPILLLVVAFGESAPQFKGVPIKSLRLAERRITMLLQKNHIV